MTYSITTDVLPQYADVLALPDDLREMFDEFGDARTEAGEAGQTCEER